MKKMAKFLIALFIFNFIITPIHSFAITKLGQTGLNFLDIGVGARASAMGEAFIMVGNDANAIFYNPAGIAQLDGKFDLVASMTDWFADIKYHAAGVVMNAGIWGNFGFSIIAPDYGVITGTRLAPTEEGYEETGILDVNALAAGFVYARELTDRFAVGGQIKYCSQHLGSNLLADDEIVENEVSGLAYDFGTIFYPGYPVESFRIGMTITNFSAQFKYEQESFQLPLTFKLGIALDILDLLGEHPDRTFVLEIDAIHPRDYSQRVHIGGEAWYKNMVALRMGYKFNYDEAGLTAGLGFNIGGIKIDYAYNYFGSFDAVNRVSLGVSY
jgi:hypothetical protein